MAIDLETFKADGNWGSAFEVAFRDAGVKGREWKNPIDHVTEVFFAAEGDNDGPDWLSVVRFADGRFAKVFAGCDYTGWG